MTQAVVDTPVSQEAWVVFCDAPGVPWLRFLRPPFRHCFVILKGPQAWISVDPLIRGIEVKGHSLRAYPNLPQMLKDQGLVVVKTQTFTKPSYPCSWGMFSCVSLVKRVLGLSAPGVLTPYRLYRRLVQAGGTPLLSTSFTQSTDASLKKRKKS
jgi:hypothetical protein